MRKLEEIKLPLKAWRELKRWTQEEAAEKIGISKDTLSNYERGKSYPDVPVIKKIEEIYDCVLFYVDLLRLNRK